MLLRAKSNWGLKICSDKPPWATCSSALLIYCEISFPLYPVGMSVVTIWICSFLSFHLQEFASVFSTVPLYTQLKMAIRFLFSLLFSRLNKPSLLNFLKVLVAHFSSLQSLRSLWMATLLANILTTSPQEMPSTVLHRVHCVLSSGSLMEMLSCISPIWPLRNATYSWFACWLLVFKPSGAVSSPLTL